MCIRDRGYTGTYRQFNFETNRAFIDATTLDTSFSDLDQERAIHTGFGLEHYLTPELLLKAEIFNKTYDLLAVNVADDPLETFANQGLGRAQGLELLLHQVRGTPLQGWVSYTYSKSERKPKDTWETPPFDITHMLNLYGEYQFEGWTLTSVLKFNTGLPYTPIVGYTTDPDTGQTTYQKGDANSKRLPDTFRVDLWVEFPVVEMLVPIPFLPISDDHFLGIFPVLHFKGKTRLGAYNVLNTQNPTRYSYDRKKKEETFVYDFPLMPVFGVMIEF